MDDRKYLSKSLLFLALSGVSSALLAADAESAVPEPSIFVTTAAQAGMTEVELGKVALAKSQNSEVREFAERMVKDHGKANSELAALAEGKGLSAPKALDAEHQAAVDALRGKNGAEFDKAYSQHMNMDHSKAIALFESATNSTDPDFAGFAKKTLPTLKEHKQMARKLPGNSGNRG